MKKLLIISILFTCLSVINGQELNCNFSINTSTISGTNRQVFTAMEEAIRDFLNNTVWTNNVFDAHERIECNILLNIKNESNATDFSGELQIQARRPVYNSSYNTVLFNYLDNDVEFTYQEGDPIELSENTFISNLSSLLSFYAYMIIGLDYDSFSLNGGTPFYEIAEKIMNTAQSSNYTGWKSSDDSRSRKNRYWLVDNLLDNDYKPLREFSYKYHRLGLDGMESSIETGKSQIFQSIEILEDFNNNRPDPFIGLLKVVLDSKAEEIVNIYSEANEAQKNKVLKIMTKLDPAGGRKYDNLKK
jgi:hypothetical protein